MALMITGLNQLTESELRQWLGASEQRLAEGRRVQERNPDVVRLPGFHVDMAVQCRRIAVCRYALGDPVSATRPLLEAVSRHYLALFLLRDLGQENGLRARGEAPDISFFTSDRMFAGLSIAVVVNLKSVIEKITTLPWDTYSSVHPPKFGLYHATMALLLDAALNRTEAALEKSQALCANAENYGAPPPLTERLLSMVRAVQAGLKLDGEDFHASLSELLRVHEAQANSDSGSRNVATLVCFEALVAMAVAIRAGRDLSCIDSPYAPLSWIG